MAVEHDPYVPAIARCLAYPNDPEPALLDLVRAVMEMPDGSDRAALEDMQRRIAATPGANNPIALIYGGATKIKGYVFEAPKLPEIRGASALLDWVNEVALPKLWGPQAATDLVGHGIIYAGGGNILAFAPAAEGARRATAIERAYTDTTLTANSVAVAQTFHLLELRFGRLFLRGVSDTFYWVDDFLRDWRDLEHPEKREALSHYYYPPDGAAHDDQRDAALRTRFLNRKTFGELVTVLGTLANRRRQARDDRAGARALPHYDLIPWAEKCQSSDVRPAVIQAQSGTDQRLLSEPSARKLAAGRAVKGVDIGNDLKLALKPWAVPEDLEQRSWERQWKAYIQEVGSNSPYARHSEALIARAARDVHEIGAASKRYIGLIYADGNNIGRLIATLKTPGEYHAVSQALRDVARAAVFQGLAEHLQPVQGEEKQGRSWLDPFEILAIGGDDLLIIVPGDRAFDIALTIGCTFEERLTRVFHDLGVNGTPSAPIDSRYAGTDTAAAAIGSFLPAVGLSAGVLIAQEQAPIFFLRELVEDLLKSAKDLAKANAARSVTNPQKLRFFGGAVDFMALKSITMVSDKIKSFRKAALGDAGPRRMIARPYTWHEFAGLLATARAIAEAKIPRSQLFRIQRLLAQNPDGGIVTSVVEYLYSRARFKDQIAATLITHLEHAWCHGPRFAGGRKGLPPWMPRGADGYETIWTDLLEIAEFVPERSR